MEGFCLRTQFRTKTFGKWILAGEHAVLRGSPALVFPLKSRSLEFEYIPHAEANGVSLILKGDTGKEIEFLFWAVLEKACTLLGISSTGVAGEYHLQSNIPLGAGLGASAAFCVAMTRFFVSQGLLVNDQAYEFARSLENIFHGESSGVDIAVVLNETGLHFERSGLRTVIRPSWSPQLYLSYSGSRGMTSECVQKVKSLLETNPDQGKIFDKQMKEAAALSEQTLLSEQKNMNDLKKAIDSAEECFRVWGLVHGNLKIHLDKLKDLGALAVKPTGSGGGGYALSLWTEKPDLGKMKSLGVELIPCFES